MVRATDIVRKKAEVTSSQNETISAKTNTPPDSLRLSNLLGPESREEKTAFSADKDALIKNLPIAEARVRSANTLYLTALTYMEGIRDNIKNNTHNVNNISSLKGILLGAVVV